MEQEPGPRGSPHEPHGPIGCVPEKPAELPLAPTANADSRFCSSWLSHEGHAGDCPARVRYSN